MTSEIFYLQLQIFDFFIFTVEPLLLGLALQPGTVQPRGPAVEAAQSLLLLGAGAEAEPLRIQLRTSKTNLGICI